MANKASAEKRMRQTAVRRARNRSHRTELRTEVKMLRQMVDVGDVESARERLPKTLSIIDRTAQRGVMHRNAASRTKSRLTRAVAALDS